jgi:hypothetical protein
MLATPSWIVTEVRVLISLKASEPIVPTVPGIVMEVILVPLNAPLAMLITSAGIITLTIEVLGALLLKL